MPHAHCLTHILWIFRYAYAVTFEQTDPLYKLDVSNPHSIVELAAVEITGFSQYLHPFDDSEEIILALGQEADENGRVLGLQISLFDLRASNINSNSKQLIKEPIRYNFEINPDQWSYSDALWDKNAVRYINGLLIIPVNMEKVSPDKGYFNGFKLFSVTETSITEDAKCSIDFNDFTSTVENYCGWLPPVSFGSRSIPESSGRQATHFYPRSVQ